ncbi:DNA-binding response regulator, OmpR family, contains REC and winged-helix (wHTH) domain [Halolactibacillus halophilus]|uniref:Heme response regulator HssR n=1 Tax=Halolactibacillus halophilus TaxID=306540 RepID=A0A1I5QZV1_9BACI|nr:response regulator transcription factor [Halolactibacillus halophilus]GEM01976.1 DNA-binding response regulator [Halolactibacillus halophilus]SFP51601.1 DNA-binding response regulator, OmpR family, contains REC and winged-helix (wHTH) domain [Halolactibacillus halophilus]
MITILVADDDQHIRQLIRLYLEKENFHVLEAIDGEEALNKFEQNRIDLAVIDVMMPRVNGIELIESIRLFSDLPILLVTAKGESDDKVIGFEVGTDDYLVKPFDPIELVLRVKALLKRHHVLHDKKLEVNKTSLDLEQLTVTTEQSVIQLKKKEMALLFTLAEEKGRILTRQQLLDKVWGYDYDGDERTVDVHIKRLREKLHNLQSFKIVTVRGLGYQLKDGF